MGMDLSGNVCVAGNTNDGSNLDIMSIKYNYEGTIIGATIFNGSANNNDMASSVATNALGEAFIAGYTINAGGNADYVIFKCAWDSLQVPAPFNATAAYTEVVLTWADNSTSEDGFYIERKAGACSSGNPWSLIKTALPDTTTHTDIGLNVGEYCYRIQAYKSNGEASRWLEKSVTTSNPSAPSGLTAVTITPTKISLSWTDNTSGETGFRIERCAGNGCSDFTEITTVGANITAYNNAGLSPATEYSYRIRAYKEGSWVTVYSNTAAAVTTVNSPSGLSATPVNTTRIDLSWTDNNVDETNFGIERCEGAGCSNFAEIGTTGQNATAYSDTTACSGTAYVYRVRAKNDSLSNRGGGCWTKRLPLTLTDYQVNYETKIIIPYDSDMQTDFDDIRFYDETAHTELPYYIESKTDGVSATVWVKAGSNNDVYLYYGNTSATSSSNGTNVFEFFDDFRGGTIDTSKWVEIDPDNAIYQNNDLILQYINYAWSKALISQQTFARTSDKKIYMKTNPGNSAGSDYFMAGWETNQTSNPSYAQLVHGIYWNNFLLTTYEKGGHTGPNTQAYAANTEYEVKIELKATGAKYFIKGGIYTDWTLVKETTTYSDSPMRIAFTQRSHAANIHLITVQKFAATEPSVVLGTEETATCYLSTWDSAYSNEAPSATPSPSAPVLSAARASEIQINLSWIDNTADETGFEILRCAGSGCIPADPAIISLGVNTTSYSDTDLASLTTYRYIVRAYKTASGCTGGRWQADSSIAEATTTIGAPGNLNAAAVNTTQINLAWTDNTASETGFKIERCEGSGCRNFAVLSTTSPDATTYSDTSVCNSTTYNYRIKAVNEGLSNSGGGCWTRRSPLTISNFQPYFQTKLTITYDADMQPDFDDIRFYDETLKLELSYWVESKTDGTSATVWVKTKSSNNISMYYGNAGATSSSSGKNTMILQEDMEKAPGGTLKNNAFYDPTNKWLRLTSAANGLGGMLEYSLNPGDNFIAEFRFWTGGGSTPGADAIWLYAYDTSTPPSEDNASGGYHFNYDEYQDQVQLQYNGGTLSASGQASIDNAVWHTAKIIHSGTNSKIYYDGTLKIDYTDMVRNQIGALFGLGARTGGYNNEHRIDDLVVRKYVATEPSVTVGSEQTSACYVFTGIWESSYTNNNTAPTTPAPAAPSGLTATAISESQINLSWTDTNPDETGFKIERKAEACELSALSFIQLVPLNDNFDSGISSDLWNQRGLLYDAAGVIAQDVIVPPIDITDGNGTSRITPSGGLIEFYTTSTGGGAANSYNNTRMYLKTPGVIQGDFDLQFDYSLPDGEITAAQYHVYTRFIVYFPNTTNGSNYVYVERAVSSAGNYYYGAVRVDGTSSGNSLTTTDTSGKLRIKRIGSTISTYAWTGGVWNLIFEINGASVSAATNLIIVQYAQRNEAVNLKANIDNLILNVSNAGATTLSDINLDSGVTYCYRLKAYKTASCGWETGYSDPPAAATTLAPPAPSGLTATPVNTTQIDLSWTDNTGSETGFVIQRCTGLGCSDFADLATVGANVTAYSDISACNSTNYRYQVRARKSTPPTFDTAYSLPASAMTPVIGNILSDWDFENTTTGWTGTVGTLTGTGFDTSVFYSAAKSLKLTATGATLGRMQTVSVTPGGQYILSGYLNANLTAGQVQCDVQGTGIDSLGIRIVNNDANDIDSWVYLNETVNIPAGTTSVNVRCFGDGTPQGTVYFDMIQFVPNPVVSLTAARSSEIQINLSWTNYTNDETGFEILRCTGAGCTPADPPIATVGADVASYSDKWLVHSTTYRYIVRAYKSGTCGWTSSSPVAEAITSISVPGGLTATAANTTQVNLVWAESTASETGLIIERCTGAGCNDFAPVGTVGPNVLSYQDINTCESTTYRYRVGTHSDGLSNSGSGFWTRRVPLSITDFKTDFLTRIVIPYDSDIQPDFDDIRFYDSIHVRELPYWIEGKTDGVSATVWIMTGSNNSIYLYYGNASAASSSSQSSVFGSGLMGFWQFNETAGTVSGTTSDASIQGNHGTLNNFAAPNGIVASGKFGNALSLDGSNDYVNRGATSLPTGNIATAEAWIYPTAYADASYNGIVSWGSRSCNGYALALSIQNTGRPSMATWCNDFVPSTATAANLNAWNHLAVVMNGTAVTLYMNGQPVSGTLTYNPNIQPNSLSIGALDYPGRYFNGFIDEIRVYNRALSASEIASRYASTEPVVSLGSEEESAAFTFTNAFPDQYSSPASATTLTANAPVLTATWSSEVQINLSWTDTNSDETGFRIFRCTGGGCADFVQIDTANQNVTGYQDISVQHSNTYRYYISAYKDAPCSWVKTGNTAEATTTITAPGSLTATPVNTTQIDLSWTDNSGSETGFIIERCTGSGCSDFTGITKTGSDTTTYSDTTVCNATTYTYHVKAINEGLSNNGGGCWTRRAPLTITNFQPKFQTKVTITYDADMQPDFDDIRFYDETLGIELPYWIESKTDGVSATIWFRTLTNNTINLYYGNSNATSAGNGLNVFEFFDDFRGSSINSSKWAEIDPDNSIYQNDDLILNDVSDSWTKALISKQTFSRASDKKIYMKLTVPTDTAGNNHFMVGWESNQTTDPNYTQLVHGMYWNNYLLSTYEKGNHTGPNTQAYAAGTDYEMKIELKTTGAGYFVKGGAYGSWTQITPSTILNYTDSPLRVAFTQYSHQANIHFIAVQKYAAVEPAVAPGPEEISACYVFTNTWGSGYSNDAPATTPGHAAPGGLTATAVTDTEIDLSWTDNTADETLFEVERCTGSGCSDFTQIGTSASNVTLYSDATISPSTTYCYRVRTSKTAFCGWDTGYSNTSCDLAFSAHPINLVATALNSFKVQLNWADASNDEDGFEIEVQIWNGKWVLISTVAQGVTSFTDTSGIEPQKEYRYRVRAYRGIDRSPYSNEAAATTPAYTQGDSTCP